jgi:hypothetical protein
LPGYPLALQINKHIVYRELWSIREILIIFGIVLARTRFPGAKIFNITTGAAVLKLNYNLGFEPVTYAEITTDKVFRDQCKSCINYPVLESKDRKMCLCIAMIFCPEKKTGIGDGRVDSPGADSKKPAIFSS